MVRLSERPAIRTDEFVWADDEMTSTEPCLPTDEDYQQGRALAAILLMLDDLERTKSLDTRSLQDLAAEAALWL